MYTLPEFLSRAPGGLYRLSPSGVHLEPKALSRIKRVQLMHLRKPIFDKKGFLHELARSMHLPRWFGMNWDAAYDCLTDFEWEPGSAHLLLLSGIGHFARRSPRDFETALSVLADASSFWAQHDIRLLVLLGCDDKGLCAWLPTVRAPGA